MVCREQQIKRFIFIFSNVWFIYTFLLSPSIIIFHTGHAMNRGSLFAVCLYLNISVLIIAWKPLCIKKIKVVRYPPVTVRTSCSLQHPKVVDRISCHITNAFGCINIFIFLIGVINSLTPLLGLLGVEFIHHIVIIQFVFGHWIIKVSHHTHEFIIFLKIVPQCTVMAHHGVGICSALITSIINNIRSIISCLSVQSPIKSQLSVVTKSKQAVIIIIDEEPFSIFSVSSWIIRSISVSE